MIKFGFNNTGVDKLILEFKCKKCLDFTKTDKLSIPQLDLETFKERQVSFKHKCLCGVCYTIEIINGLYGSFGRIHGIDGNEEDVFVNEVPDPPYDKDTILVDTIESYSKIESIINGIEGMNKDNKNYIYCLLFTNLVTILDSFIKIYTESIILSNDNLIEKFSIVFEMHNGNIEEKKKKTKRFYDRKSFQSLSNQKRLFKEVFNIDIVIDERIERFVAIRNVIIHRNAFDTDGFMHIIKKSQLLQALDVIKKYIHQIHSALLDYETEICVDKLLNKQCV